MGTLTDSFLADVEDLFDNEENDKEATEATILKFNNFAKLQKCQHFHDLMKKVNEAILQQQDCLFKGEDDSGDQLTISCSTLCIDIDNEIAIIHNFVRDKYQAKFPELESVVLHPVDYSRVVKQIGNEMDLTLVPLEHLLPSSTIMVVTTIASTTRGKPLSAEILTKTIDACDQVLALDEAKKKVLKFLESRMECIAPNLSDVVGSAIAAKLIGAAGGLATLATMPSCNIPMLGAKRKTLVGFSTATQLPNASFVYESNLVQSCPPLLRKKACRQVVAKCTLAARADYHKPKCKGGLFITENGKTFRQEIQNKIDKWQESHPPRQPKPLPIPKDDQRKKRGGHRQRKMKERYAMTERQKRENRMKFSVAEE